MLHSLLRAVVSLSIASSSLAITPGFPYGSQKVRGVNLGGWLVLEVRVNRFEFIHDVDITLAMDHAIVV